jgi:RecA-family ATPase
MSTFKILPPNEWNEPSLAPWLWQGYLAAGNITLLAAQWKAGKTTLLAALLARMQSGGELAGLAVKPGRPVVLSEEWQALWQARDRQYHFGENIGLLSRPFQGAPSDEKWAELIDQLAQQRATVGLDLFVIDTLLTFLPCHNENSANVIADALLPLQRLTSLGVAVLIMHHTRKQESADGKMARGSGALAGFADILMEMHYYGSPESSDRRRRIQAWSRHPQTPRQLIIEWMPDGSYIARGDREDEEFRSHWDLLDDVLLAANRKLTREQIHKEWPQGHEPPDPATLWRWLTRAVNEGRIERGGAGNRYDPHQYWLKEKEADFRRPGTLPDLPPIDDLW